MESPSTELQQHRARIEKLEERVDGLEPGWAQVLEALEAMEKALNGKVQATQAQVQATQAQVQATQAQVQALNRQVQTLEGQVQAVDGQVGELRRDMDNRFEELRKLIRRQIH